MTQTRRLMRDKQTPIESEITDHPTDALKGAGKRVRVHADSITTIDNAMSPDLAQHMTQARRLIRDEHPCTINPRSQE